MEPSLPGIGNWRYAEVSECAPHFRLLGKLVGREQETPAGMFAEFARSIEELAALEYRSVSGSGTLTNRLAAQ
jgi:hypothetical protein